MVEFVSLESIKTEVDYSTPGWPYMANATRITSAKIVNAPAPLLRASSEQLGRKIWYNIGWLIMQLKGERIGRSTTKAFVTSWDNVAFPILIGIP